MKTKTLYKYRPIYNYEQLSFVKEIVLKNTIFLSPATHFTDPFDGFTEKNSSHKNKTILSLTENKNSRLLWAYYGGWYSGVMIGFNININHKPFCKIRKIRYEQNQKTLIEKLKNNDLFTKSIEFCHEGEWRLVNDKAETHIKFPRELLVSITIGPSLPNIYKVNLIASCREENVEIIEYEYDSHFPLIR